MTSEAWLDLQLVDLAADSPNATVGGPFGSNLLASDFVGAGVPVIRGENLSGRWVSGPFVYVTSEKARSLSGNIARPGDVIFTQRGTLGQVSIVPDGPYQEYIVSQSQMKLTSDSKRVDAKFVYYTFRSPELLEYTKQNAIRTGVPHTNLGILRRTPVRLPSLATQQGIASVLGHLDDKIELNSRTNHTLESMARALFRSWFVDFDPVRAKMEGRPTGLPDEVAALFPDRLVDSPIGDVPEGWEVREIGDVVEVSGGSTPSTKDEKFWDGGIFWATPKDLSALQFPVLLETARTLTEEGLAATTSGLLPPGTVLLSSRAPIGYLVITEVPAAVNQGFIALKCGTNPSNQYILQWCRTNADAIVARANGTTFLEISKKNFRPMPIIVPPAKVMDAYTSIAASLHARIVANVKQAKTLADLRDTLLPKLLSGEVRVPMEPSEART